MARLTVKRAQRILADKRYSTTKKREAKKFLKEVKKTKSKPKKVLKKRKKISKVSKKKPRKKATKTKVKRKAKKKAKVKTVSKSGKIKFFDVKTKKYVSIPRGECKLKKNRSARGGDQLIANYKGRKLYTFVKRGFQL